MSGRLARHLVWLSLALGLLFGGSGAGTPVGAEGPGAIGGHLVNGTAGAALPAGLEAVLHTFQGQKYQGERRAPVGADGSFRITGLDLGDDFTYQVTADSGDITYRSDPLKLTAAQPEQAVELKVYETTATDPGLRGTRAFVIIGDVIAEDQLIVMSELIGLANPADRTFAPNPGGGGAPVGPAGLIRFGLPAGARDLRPSLGFDPARVIQVDRGFGSLAPIFPGEQEFGYLYRVPYSGREWTLEKSFAYGLQQLQVVAPETGPTVTSPALTPGPPIDLGGRRYRSWTAKDLAPGTRLNLELAGLPPPPVWRLALNGLAQRWVFPTILGLSLLVGLGWALRRRPAELAPAPTATADLLRALIELDEAYADGSIDEATYRAERAARKAQLRSRIAAGERLPEPVIAGSAVPETPRA